VAYPTPTAEEEMLYRYHQGFHPHQLAATGVQPLMTPEQLTAVRQTVQAVTVEKGILSYITQISNASREARELFLGGSPRASVALLQASKVHAALQGRAFVTPDDIKAVALPVYRHRIILKPETMLEGLDADAVIGRILNSIEVPR